ncbi:hypothetical protein [Parendozoicomonas haliclonae]|uniref:Flagellar protein FliT n=1 Tax=Parendozoicomonas haliclonae TaxID=1960125 RepID=A0A1X7AGK3_9GAMM|nr:hypothetical protein [Parendozoicomonas haliclonae]SMA39846.1 hypothetical protein EHSB41UT_01104 [Parendozoicomonas haliclonae]
MPEASALTAEHFHQARHELQQAWDLRDWSLLMTREHSVRKMAEQAFADKLPDGELRDALMALQQQYLRIVEEMTSERNQLKEQLDQQGSKLRAVRHYHATDRMKGYGE